MSSRYLARFNEDKNYIVLDLNAFDFFSVFPSPRNPNEWNEIECFVRSIEYANLALKSQSRSVIKTFVELPWFIFLHYLILSLPPKIKINKYFLEFFHYNRSINVNHLKICIFTPTVICRFVWFSTEKLLIV